MRVRVEETIKAFAREIAETNQPRVLTLPLHPHLVGVPHRMNDLIEIIDSLRSRPDTIFMTGRDIAEWFVGQSSPADLFAETRV